MTSGANLEQKQAWMRERGRSPAPESAATLSGTHFDERHFTPAEIAELWHLSPDAVRKIFEREPGVLILGDSGSPGKRRYITLRIPESVAERVHRRMLRR